MNKVHDTNNNNNNTNKNTNNNIENCNNNNNNNNQERASASSATEPVIALSPPALSSPFFVSRSSLDHTATTTTTTAAATTTAFVVAQSFRRRLFRIRRHSPVLFRMLLLVSVSLAVMLSVLYTQPSLSLSVSPYETEETRSPFCQVTSHPMTMFMDGFHRSFFVSSSSSLSNAPERLRTCLSYMIESWQLTTRASFVGALLASFTMAFGLEGLSAARGWMIRQQRRRRRQQQQQQQAAQQQGQPYRSAHGDDYNHFHQHYWYPNALTLLYVTQAFLGYLIMLFTMSFSTELFASVVLGLMAGNVVFLPYNDDEDDEETKNDR